MSFLELEEDPMATLEEALAFIDNCDSSPCDVAMGGMKDVDFEGFQLSEWSATPVLDDLNLGYASFLVEEHAQKQSQMKKGPVLTKKKAATTTKKVRRREPGASTKLQRRKKAELLSLQEQALQLESQLEELKRARSERYQYEHSADSRVHWSSVAAAQYEERLQAEKTNHKLKVILANQRKVHDSIRVVLQKPSSLAGKECLLPCGFVQRTRPPMADLEVAMAQLRQRVAGLYLDTASVLPSEELPSLSSQMVVKPHHQHGKVIELSTTTPLSCSVIVAADLIWRNLVSAQEQANKLKTIERSCSMPVSTAAVTLGLHKLHFVRKFEETDRVVLVWSAVMVHQDRNLQFRDHAWIAIKRSQTNPLGACVVQTRLQLYPEPPRGGSSSQSTGLSDVQDAVLSALGEKFRQCLQGMQDSVIEQAGELSMFTPIAV